MQRMVQEVVGAGAWGIEVLLNGSGRVPKRQQTTAWQVSYGMPTSQGSQCFVWRPKDTGVGGMLKGKR